MSRPPRNPDAKFFGGKKILFSVFKGALLLAVVLGVYYFSNYEQHTEAEIRAITFTSLILGNLFFILSALSATRSFIASLLERNIALLSILFIACSMLLALLLVPSLSDIFNFEFPGMIHFLPSLVASFILLLILEAAKKLGINR
jgi:Ca2+-transporting ATPase